MKRWCAVAMMLAVLTGCSSRNPGSQGGRIRAVMDEFDGGLHKDLRKLLLANPVDWSQAGPMIDRYQELAAELPRVVPEKGSRESWQKLSSAFAADAETMKAVAAKHNKIEAFEAWNRLNKGCLNCHAAHR